MVVFSGGFKWDRGGLHFSDRCLGPVDKKFNPKPRGGDIEEAHEGQGGFVVAGCNTPHLLEFVEHPLNAVAVSVTPPVCFLWNTAAFREGITGRIPRSSRSWRNQSLS